MDDHTRSRKRCQEAIIFHHPSRDLHQQPGRFSPRPGKKDQFSITAVPNLFVVGRAYQEPGCGDCIEDLLLQRDYIID